MGKRLGFSGKWEMEIVKSKYKVQQFLKQDFKLRGKPAMGNQFKMTQNVFNSYRILRRQVLRPPSAPSRRLTLLDWYVTYMFLMLLICFQSQWSFIIHFLFFKTQGVLGKMSRLMILLFTLLFEMHVYCLHNRA